MGNNKSISASTSPAHQRHAGRTHSQQSSADVKEPLQGVAQRPATSSTAERHLYPPTLSSSVADDREDDSVRDTNSVREDGDEGRHRRRAASCTVDEHHQLLQRRGSSVAAQRHLTLTKGQVHHVQKMWALRNRKQCHHAGSSIFADIFAQVPKAKLIFERRNTTFRAHYDSFQTSLDYIIEHLEDEQTLNDYLLDLGKKHTQYRAEGFDPYLWHAFGQAMIQKTFQWDVQIRRNTHLQQAWCDTVLYIMEQMRRGYYDEIRRVTHTELLERSRSARSARLPVTPTASQEPVHRQEDGQDLTAADDGPLQPSPKAAVRCPYRTETEIQDDHYDDRREEFDGGEAAERQAVDGVNQVRRSPRGGRRPRHYGDTETDDPHGYPCSARDDHAQYVDDQTRSARALRLPVTPTQEDARRTRSAGPVDVNDRAQSARSPRRHTRQTDVVAAEDQSRPARHARPVAPVRSAPPPVNQVDEPYHRRPSIRASRYVHLGDDDFAGLTEVTQADHHRSDVGLVASETHGEDRDDYPDESVAASGANLYPHHRHDINRRRRSYW